MDSHFAAGAWAREQGFTFPMLGDLNRKAIQPYGVMLEELSGYQGISNRAIFVIDKIGSVAHADVIPQRGMLPDADAALNTVRRLAGR